MAGPLPAAVARTALPVLERRLEAQQLKLAEAWGELRTNTVEAEPAELVNVNRPEDLAEIRARR